jgi:hypothetical protein
MTPAKHLRNTPTMLFTKKLSTRPLPYLPAEIVDLIVDFAVEIRYADQEHYLRKQILRLPDGKLWLSPVDRKALKYYGDSRDVLNLQLVSRSVATQAILALRRQLNNNFLVGRKLRCLYFCCISGHRNRFGYSLACGVMKLLEPLVGTQVFGGLSLLRDDVRLDISSAFAMDFF